MAQQDYYETLGVPRNASKDEIKRAFRQQARQYHPDVSSAPDAEQRFKTINEAYEILSDDQKRAQYDRFGHAGVSGAGGMGGYGAAGFGGFEDIFEEFFSGFGGTRTQRTGPRSGSDRQADVNISFEESVFGAETEVTFHRLETCDVCDGVGAESGSHPETCPDCQGSGEIRRTTQTFIGSVVRVNACPRCGGKGSIIKNPCRKCDGSGRVRRQAVLNVKIPPGIHDGLRIQVRSEGDVGELGARTGDLYVSVHVDEHEYFKRRENDIILDINVNVAQAALGDKIIVPTVDGDVELKVPSGTQTGKVFRLRGKGIPRLRTDGTNAGRGDQLVYVQVAVPTELSERQAELFTELSETFGNEPSVDLRQNGGRGFFDRVMDLFGND